MARSPRIAVVLAAVLAVAVPTAPLAQETSAQEAQPSSAQTPPPPTAIPAPEVVVRANADTQRLETIRSQAAADPAIETIGVRMAEVAEIRDQLVADIAGRDPRELSPRALQAQRERWQRYKDRLDRWQTTLAARSQALGTDQEAHARIEAVWQATAEAAARGGYPGAAVRTVQNVRAAADAVGTTIRERVDVVLTLQDRVVTLNREAAETLARLDAAGQDARWSLLQPDQPPLWTVIAAGRQQLSWTGVIENATADLNTIGRFVAESAGSFTGQFVTSLVLLVLMILLGRRAHVMAAGSPEIERTAGLFARPVSAAILIVVLTVRLFHPTVPAVLMDVVRALALIPLLRLLPLLLAPAMRGPLHVFAALWLLHGVTGFLPDGSLVQRLGALAVSVVSLGGFVWFLRRVQPGSAPDWKHGPARGLVRLGAGVLALAVIANVLGLVGLARSITSGTLLSVLLAGATYAGAAVLQLLVWLLLRTGPAQSIPSIHFNTGLIADRFARVVRIAAKGLWVAGTLRGFDLLGSVYAVTVRVLTTPLTVGSLSISLGNIVAFFLAIWIATLVARFTKFILEHDVLPRLTLPRGVPGAVTKVSEYLIIGLGLVVAVGAAGFDFSNIAFLAGALGVGIGFGLQNIVSNFVSGLILIFERPIQVGDSIQLDTMMGTMKDIGIRASTIRTFEGADVLVPNADLIAGRVVNWTLSDRLRRIEIPVGVAYGSDPRTVERLLLGVATALPDCLKTPEPTVLFKGFGESALEFEVRFWTANFDRWVVIRSEATYGIHDALRTAGITIPFPQRDVHIASTAPPVSPPPPPAGGDAS
jgi:potassium efflux system protein